MSDLIDWLRQQIDVDELWALAASATREGDDSTTQPGGLHWTWGVGDNWDPVDPDPLEPYIGGHDGRWSRPVVLRSVEEWHLGYGPPSNTLPVKVCDGEEVR